MTRLRPHHLLLLAPFVWQLALAPAANGVAWAPIGLPFPMLWQMAGILVASVAIALVYRRDRARPDAEE